MSALMTLAKAVVLVYLFGLLLIALDIAKMSLELLLEKRADT